MVPVEGGPYNQVYLWGISFAPFSSLYIDNCTYNPVCTPKSESTVTPPPPGHLCPPSQSRGLLGASLGGLALTYLWVWFKAACSRHFFAGSAPPPFSYGEHLTVHSQVYTVHTYIHTRFLFSKVSRCPPPPIAEKYPRCPPLPLLKSAQGVPTSKANKPKMVNHLFRPVIEGVQGVPPSLC